MLDEMKKRVAKVAQALWCHKVSYVAMAGLYGGLALGLEKSLFQAAMVLLYLALACQRH